MKKIVLDLIGCEMQNKQCIKSKPFFVPAFSQITVRRLQFKQHVFSCVSLGCIGRMR